MTWSKTPPTEAGLYYVRHRESGEEQPGFLHGVSWFFMWPYEDWFPADCPEEFLFGPAIPLPEQCHENDDHAQVGALLAKCIGFEMGKDHDGWWAWARLPGREPLTMGEGPTQLAAIRAAVEAAEQGVRE